MQSLQDSRGAASISVRRVRDSDVEQLVDLIVDYCEFYGTAPGVGALERLVRHLRRHPQEGLQLVADGGGGELLGFATLYWSWSTTRARRIAIMNDLYVAPGQRGRGIGRSLIRACACEARAHGADSLGWQTRPDNRQAQALYESVGARREEWVDYFLPVDELAGDETTTTEEKKGATR